MNKLWTAGWLFAASASLLSCTRHAPTEDDGAKGKMLADTGFRPTKNGYKFQNEGGQYPKTPPVLTATGVAKLFGKDACLGGNEKSCKLTPAATEWMGVVNRAMNIGQCEGMAVSTLAFFKKVYEPSAYAAGATSVHDLTHANVGPLIGYFWAFQMVNPVRLATAKSMVTQTPNSVEDQLIEMMKRGELATVAIRSTHGGHAVTPYAVEDRGGGIHWIRIYDNNWPDKERYIIIDRNENTWKYELASLNPDVPREPWAGTADTHTIAVTPLSARLGRAECPFCVGSGRKVVIPHGTNSISLTNHDGKRLGREGDKMVNEIPDAEVVDLNTYLDGASAGEPMYVVPAEGDYEVSIHGTDRKDAAHEGDEDHGVAIIGNGSAVAVETSKLKTGDHDTLSLAREGGVKYASGSGGTIPPIRLARDGGGSGMQVRIANMKADAHEAVELNVDHHTGSVTVAGGGKRSESYDLKVKHVHDGAEDHEVEQKGIKFKAGEAQTIHTDPKPGAKATPFKIKSAPYVPKKTETRPAREPAKENGREPAREQAKHPTAKPAPTKRR